MKFKNREVYQVVEVLNHAVVKNVEIYDLTSITPYFDFSIICTANSARQAHAAVDYLKDFAEKNKIIVKGYTKDEGALWQLVDMNNIIVHVFVGDERNRYHLDDLYYELPKDLIED